MESVCKTAIQKVKAFSHNAWYVKKHRAYVLCKNFIKSIFNYCPLIWIFSGRTANGRICQLSMRVLRALQCDYTSTFEELLVKSEETTIHCSNLQKPMSEIFECTNYISPPFLSEYLTTKEINCDLRIKNLLQVPKVKTLTCGQSPLSFRDSML